MKEHSSEFPLPIPCYNVEKEKADSGEDLDQQSNSEKIKLHMNKIVFPHKVCWQEYAEYYSNKEEHPFATKFDSKVSHYEPTFSVQLEVNSKDELYIFLMRYLLLSDKNLTGAQAKLHQLLTEEFTERKTNTNFTDVGRKEVPSAGLLFYCAVSHKRNGDRGKSSIFHFFHSNFCTECQCEIPVCDYIALFSLREQVHLRLLCLSKTTRKFLKQKHKEQKAIKDNEFNGESVIHDVDSALLNHIIRKNGFYDSCDLALLVVFNTDAVALKRKSRYYKNVWGIWLAFASLPIDLRFEPENMILMGLYGNRDNLKLSTSTLDPFLEQINLAYDPFQVDLGDETLSVRVFLLGATLDGVEVPRVFNTFPHTSYFQCCSCDFCAQYHSDKKKMYFHRAASAFQYSAR